MSNPYATLDSPALREAAKELVQPKNPARHWTVMASMIGAVEDRRLWTDWGFRSLRAWAESELDLAPEDCLDALKLWRLVQMSQLPLERWAEVSKAKAKVVMRALGMGGDADAWIQKALAAENAQELMDDFRRLVGDEVWVEFTVPIPNELLELVNAALILALSEFLEGDIPADRAAQLALVDKRENKFRCLEVVCTAYIHGRRP